VSHVNLLSASGTRNKFVMLDARTQVPAVGCAHRRSDCLAWWGSAPRVRIDLSKNVVVIYTSILRPSERPVASPYQEG
jgi:hypothetical protein